VPVNTLVSATFSEPMNPLTLTNLTFTVTGPGVTPVAGVVTYTGSTATFTPTTVLASSTLLWTYQCRLPNHTNDRRDAYLK
jgi:hypothetical protein